jgi:hypothetical protein
MYQQDYYVPKSSGTLSDALLAYGLAVLLRQLLPGTRRHRPGSVRIEDRGTHYVICLPQAIQEQWLEDISDLLTGLASAIKRKKDIPEGVLALDYNETWDKIRQLNALRAEHRKGQGEKKEQAIEELEENFSPPHRDVVLLIGDYRMQVEGIHNQAVIQWHETMEAGYTSSNLRAILQMFAHPYADMDAVEKNWAAEVKQKGIKRRLTASQVFNPNQGKGSNRPKADRLTMDNQDHFWLVEYLKVVGVFAAVAPCAFPDDNMRKTYVLAPYNIELANHKAIFKRFERAFYGLSTSPIKADVLASLKYTREYLSYYSETKSEEEVSEAVNPGKSVRGFYAASYVLLSPNSFTMINLSFLGLPPWLHSIDTWQDVAAVQSVIEEHALIIQPLEEKFQEGSSLLSSYRDFLAGNQLDAFFDFCADYGEYVVHTLRTQSRVKQYSIKSLDEIFRRIPMSEQDTTHPDDLTEFSSSSGKHLGFHRIAYAIRRSTVIPQRQKANHKANPKVEESIYEVRYGVGHNLRRKANSAREFMDALTEFVQIYNAETEQKYEETNKEVKQDLQNYALTHYRSRVSIGDLDDILELVKTYGPHLVCNMLVAYGYATGGKNTKDGDSQDTDNTNKGEE